MDELYNLSDVSRGALIMKSMVFKFRERCGASRVIFNSVVGDSEDVWQAKIPPLHLPPCQMPMPVGNRPPLQMNEWKLIAVEFVRGARPGHPL